MKKLICLLFACLLSWTMVASFAETLPVSYEEEDIQLDLVGKSSIVVYSMISNIVMDPSSSLGQVIRIEGYYDVLVDSVTGLIYHYCIIPDATSCCAQGFEFVWGGEHVFPDEYLPAGSELTVTGRLESYEEEGYLYLHLVDSEVVWQDAEEQL